VCHHEMLNHVQSGRFSGLFVTEQLSCSSLTMFARLIFLLHQLPLSKGLKKKFDNCSMSSKLITFLRSIHNRCKALEQFKIDVL
jgi:hypothetical protein